LTAPTIHGVTIVTSPIAGDDELHHICCCVDDDLALCGRDVSDEPYLDNCDGERDCLVCKYLDAKECVGRCIARTTGPL